MVTREVVDIRRFGARGDGQADDTDAFHAAYAAAQRACARHAVLVSVPPGRYLISGAWEPRITCAHDLAITGAGEGISALAFAATDGFDIVGAPATGNLDVSLRDMSLLTADGTATYAHVGVAVSSPRTGRRNVHFSAEHLFLGDATLARSRGWAVGLDLNTTTDADLDGVVVRMPDWSGGAMGVGVRISGADATTGAYAISTHVRGSAVQGGYAGIVVGHFVQTVDISGSALVGNDFGVRWDGSTTDDFAEDLQVTGTNFNDSADDIWTKAVGENQIAANMLLQLGDQPGWAAIRMESGGYAAIVGNTIVGLPTSKAGSDGIVLVDQQGSSSAVTGNVITGLHGTCIVMAGTTTMVSASGNLCNGPDIVEPYKETETGRNMLGSISFNSYPAPVRFDGRHLDLLQPFAVVGPAGTTYLATDGVSGVHVASAGGSSGALSVDGVVTTRVHTVSTLPACTVRDEGGRSGVSDAATRQRGEPLGRKVGSFHVPVYCAGAFGWVVD